MNITDLMTAMPWGVQLFTFAVMAALLWRAMGLLALQRAQTTLPAPPVAPSAPPAPIQPPIIAPPPPAPSPPKTGLDAAPDWFQRARKEIGFHEIGANHGIDRFIKWAHAGSDGDPWCAIFSNAMLEGPPEGDGLLSVRGSRSASSQSFRTDPNFVKLPGPALGAIAVFWRGSQASGLGHVGFYRGEDAARVWVLGGNESDMVQTEALPKSSSNFGLIGYWWPKSVPLPATGAVLMPAGSPTSVKVAPADAVTTKDGVQTNIVATYFSSQENSGSMGSAYGGPIIDNSPGVALPLHFQGKRPRVRVTNKANGKSVDCDIVDVGPWNTNDPYWMSGTRPQAETGTDTRGRHTNKAGIDLTLAAITAIDLPEKGIVDWQFIDDTQSASQPKVT